MVELHPDRDRQNHTAMLARDVVLTVAAAQSRYQAATPAAGRPTRRRPDPRLGLGRRQEPSQPGVAGRGLHCGEDGCPGHRRGPPYAPGGSRP
jgi:hypothetical protein